MLGWSLTVRSWGLELWEGSCTYSALFLSTSIPSMAGPLCYLENGWVGGSFGMAWSSTPVSPLATFWDTCKSVLVFLGSPRFTVGFFSMQLLLSPPSYVYSELRNPAVYPARNHGPNCLSSWDNVVMFLQVFGLWIIQPHEKHTLGNFSYWMGIQNFSPSKVTILPRVIGLGRSKQILTHSCFPQPISSSSTSTFSTTPTKLPIFMATLLFMPPSGILCSCNQKEAS